MAKNGDGVAAGDAGTPPAGRHVLVCGGTECPTCGRQTVALIGPCDGCTESFAATGKFLRRKAADRG